MWSPHERLNLWEDCFDSLFISMKPQQILPACRGSQLTVGFEQLLVWIPGDEEEWWRQQYSDDWTTHYCLCPQFRNGGMVERVMVCLMDYRLIWFIQRIWDWTDLVTNLLHMESVIWPLGSSWTIKDPESITVTSFTRLADEVLHSDTLGSQSPVSTSASVMTIHRKQLECRSHLTGWNGFSDFSPFRLSQIFLKLFLANNQPTCSWSEWQQVFKGQKASKPFSAAWNLNPAPLPLCTGSSAKDEPGKPIHHLIHLQGLRFRLALRLRRADQLKQQIVFFIPRRFSDDLCFHRRFIRTQSANETLAASLLSSSRSRLSSLSVHRTRMNPLTRSESLWNYADSE